MRKFHILYSILFLILIIGAGYIFFTENQNKLKSKTYLASGHPEWPPIMWQQNQKIIGLGSDLTQKIFTELGLKIESKFYGSWDEVLKKAETGEIDVIVGGYKTAERTNYFDFSEPYAIDPIVLLVKKGESFKFENWEDLVNKKGLGMIKDSYGPKFDKFIKTKLNVIRVKSYKDALILLEQNKYDYFIYSLYSSNQMLAEKDLTDKIEILPKYVAANNFYIMISKKSPLTKLLPKINTLIVKYKDDRTIARLMVENKDKVLKNFK